jgi:chromate reductase, NAD(P)H dehydrogenase (quinone)
MRHVLAIAGSLRRGSFNRSLLRAAAELAPRGMTVAIEEDLASVPLFDEDLENAAAGGPAAVARLRAKVASADGLLIATPEYNWGIPGFLKNAIDWASRPASDIPHVFGDLPVALIGAGGSGGTRVAQNAWQAVFRHLKMRPWAGQTLYVDRARERFDEHNRLADEATREQLRAVVSGFAAHCAELPRTRPG